MIRVVIAEDQGMLRSALATLLDLEPDIKVVGKASDGAAALDLIRRLDPDVCLLDIDMPKLNGLDVADRLKASAHSCKAVIVTTFARIGYLQRALEANVYGYLLKDTPSDELAAAIRAIVKGKRIFSSDLSFNSLREANPLSERELDILKLAAVGQTSQAIAKTLYLSHGTVRNYISVILQKLNAANRMEAIAVAKEKGWLD
ncbi:response regulator [Camelliibacillus cellulosilyticus]|uniref:Response regulator n=1 Tax=Camelliibacillus cellulosilyticus TaxID=2174486 RepID=A0ABV9GKY1_9BACL